VSSNGCRTGARSLEGKEERKMNKTEKVLVVLGSVFCFVLLGSSAFSQGYRGEFPTGTVGGTYQPMGWSPYEASRLIGYHVTTTTGGTLGQISSLVIDKTNGRVALFVLSDVPNMGGEVLAIPYSSITNVGPGTWEFNPGSMDIGVAFGSGYHGGDPYVYSLTRYPSYSEFYGLPPAIDVAWLNGIYAHYGQVPYWTEGGGQPQTAMELFESNRLMGAGVQLPGGNAAGRINDFVVDSSDGRIVFLVLSGVSGRPTTLVAVPFSTLSVHGENVFMVNTTEEQLALAPGFDESSDLGSSRWAGDVYRYFGQQPYWTEQTEVAPFSGRPERMEPKPHTLEWHERYGY
jgi:sporulation protein YlmC with PRC-barrel domain